MCIWKYNKNTKANTNTTRNANTNTNIKQISGLKARVKQQWCCTKVPKISLLLLGMLRVTFKAVQIICLNFFLRVWYDGDRPIGEGPSMSCNRAWGWLWAGARLGASNISGGFLEHLIFQVLYLAPRRYPILPIPPFDMEFFGTSRVILSFEQYSSVNVDPEISLTLTVWHTFLIQNRRLVKYLTV